jgi:hypothetical protein
MKQVELNGKDYNVPESWLDINLKAYIAIKELFDKEFKSESEKILFIISALTGIDKNDLLSLAPKSFYDLANMFDWVEKDKLTDHSKDINENTYIEIDGDKYKVTQFNQITMGEKISLEIHSKESPKDFEVDLFTIMTKKVISKDGEPEELEPYNASTHNIKRELFLEKMIITDVFKLYPFFLSGKKDSI